MSMPTHNAAPARFPPRIRGLIAVHIGLSLVSMLCGPMEGPTLGTATRFAFHFAETSLLAMYAALAPTSGKPRWIIAVVACAWAMVLAAALFRSTGDPGMIITLTVFGAVLIGGGVLRFGGRGLVCYAAHEPQPPSEPLRFTIIQLFIGTTIIAMVAASVHWLQGRVISNEGLTVVVFSSLFLTSPFLTLWAALGRGDPRVRGLLILVLAACLGIMPVLYAGPSRPNERLWIFSYIFFVQAAVMLVSLLVVRSCRYRLARMDSAQLADSSKALEAPLAAVAENAVD